METFRMLDTQRTKEAKIKPSEVRTECNELKAYRVLDMSGCFMPIIGKANLNVCVFQSLSFVVLFTALTDLYLKVARFARNLQWRRSPSFERLK